MIAYFPAIYPDELVYSWFCRYYVHSGCLSHKMALCIVKGQIIRARSLLEILPPEPWNRLVECILWMNWF